MTGPAAPPAAAGDERASGSPTGWRAAALLALMLAAVNSPVFLAGRTLLPMSLGLVFPAYGYVGADADGIITLDSWGAMSAGYAYDLYAARSLASGTLPLWNPYQGLGQPFLANGLSAVLYPVNWLHLVVPHPWWDLVWLVNWWLAALFLCAFLALVGIPRGAALVGAAVIFASGYFQGYLALREVAAVAAWWPLLLYGVERAVREPRWRWRHLVLAVAVYGTVTGGQPEVTFVSLLTALVYGALRLPRPWWRAAPALAALVPGPVIGLALSAPAWIPFAAYAFTAFSIHPAGAATGQAHLHPATFAAYVFPFLYGTVNALPFGPIPGWDWESSPGWLPAGAAFLALASVATPRARRTPALWFLWGVAVVTAAKIWGLPGVDLLGRLPVLERIGYPRFAAFLLALCCAGLAAHGVRALADADSRRWARWMLAWCVLVGAVLALGVRPIWAVVRAADSSSAAWITFLVFGELGLLWALLPPLGLWWLAARRPGEPGPLYGLAALGILLHGVASACSGYVLATYLMLSVAGLIALAIAALGLGLARGLALNAGAAVAGCALVALLPLLAAHSAAPSLPRRYDPLSRPPYLDALAGRADVDRHRSYSLDSAFQANYAMPFALSSLNVLEAILPVESAEFLRAYVDRGANPLWTMGNLSPKRDGGFRAVDEFWRNKRYFDLIGVRYLVTDGPLPSRAPHAAATDLAMVYEDPKTRTRIWENRSAVPRVFLAPAARRAASSREALDNVRQAPDATRLVWIERGPELDSPWPAGEAPGELLGFELTPNEVAVRYRARTPGILTLTDTYADGWGASVNGREAPVLRVDGVFRGVRLDEAGIYDVRFSYRPPHWRLALSIALAGGLWLVAAQWRALGARRDSLPR